MAKKKASATPKSSAITADSSRLSDPDGCSEQDTLFLDLKGWTLTKKVDGRIVTATEFVLSAQEKNGLKGKKRKVKHLIPGNGGTPSDSIDIPITKSGNEQFVNIEYRVEDTKSQDSDFFGAGKLVITIRPK